MKHSIIQKFIALALLLTISLTACAAPKPNQNGADFLDGPVTLGALADYFIQAADDYHPGANRAQVLEGLSETQPATRLELFVLASRAFGELPIPTGNSKNLAPPPVDLSGAPEWAWPELANLSGGGILAASDLGFTEWKTGEDKQPGQASEDFSTAADSAANTAAEGGEVSAPSENEAESGSAKEAMDSPTTWREVEVVARRFFQIFASNQKDDFYAAINSPANKMQAFFKRD